MKGIFKDNPLWLWIILLSSIVVHIYCVQKDYEIYDRVITGKVVYAATHCGRSCTSSMLVRWDDPQFETAGIQVSHYSADSYKNGDTFTLDMRKYLTPLGVMGYAYFPSSENEISPWIRMGNFVMLLAMIMWIGLCRVFKNW